MTPTTAKKPAAKKAAVKKPSVAFNCIPLSSYPKSLRDAAKVVHMGMKWLDKNRPGWEAKVNTAKLDLSDGQTCMVGQLFKEYFKVIISDSGFNEDIVDGEVSMTDAEAGSRGFNDNHANYDQLTAVWFLEINNRKGVCKF